MAALREAEAVGAEAIYVAADGEVLEAPTASVVVVVDGEPRTPPAEEVGILPGTTVAFFGDALAHRRVPIGDLRRAEEVLLLSSVRGVVPVHTLDDRPVGDGDVGPVGRRLATAYEDAVRRLAGA
jgi:4-amino-4-deoxychorismate lyase